MKLTHKNRLLAYSILVVAFLPLTACKMQYSFTGINTTAKTVYIGNFSNRAGGGPPDLGQVFTEKLKEYYLRNSNLSIVSNLSEADLIIEGEVNAFQLIPFAVTAADLAAQNRLTIGVNLSFEDTREKQKNFKQSVSHYFDFPAAQTLTQVERQAIDVIYDRIALDIFNKTLSDW